MFIFDLQTAIHAAIKADTRITEDVFDFVPENVSGIYIVIGDGLEVPHNTKTFQQSDITTYTHVWGDGTDKPRIQVVMGYLWEDLAKTLETVDQEYRLHRVESAEVKNESPDLVRGTITITHTVVE